MNQAKALIENVTSEFGVASIRQNWVTVNFTETFSDTPTVFAQIQTEAGSDDCMVELRGITTTGFQMRLEEDRGSDRSWFNGGHYYEDVAWIAFDPTELVAGYGAEAGMTNFYQYTYNYWHPVSFTGSFAEAPMVFYQTQTRNGGHTERTDISNITASGFSARIEEDMGNGMPGGWDGVHVNENIAYLALDSALDLADDGILTGTEGVGNGWETICFNDDCSDAFTAVPGIFANIQTEYESDTAQVDLRDVTVAGFDIRLDEVTQGGWDGLHVDETVAWMAYGEVIPALPPEPQFEPGDYNVLVIDTDSNLDGNVRDILVGMGYNVDFQPSSYIESGVPADYDLIAYPGGEDPVYDAMGASLQSSVQAFADAGGDFIGICGGAIAGSENMSLAGIPWPLSMLGIGDGVTANYDMNLTDYIGYPYDPEFNIEMDHPIFGDSYGAGDTISLAYRGGPVFTAGPGVEVLATYVTDIDEAGMPFYDADGQPAIVASEYDANGDGTAGQVVLFAIHPEMYADTNFLLENAAQWVIEQ